MRSLRPFAFALCWLVLFEALLRLVCAPDPRAVRDPEHPYGCFADGELAQLIAARQADGVGDGAGATSAVPLDVVLVGDSVLASVENADGQRLSDALQVALPKTLGTARVDAGEAGPQVRVWTLAAGGARAIDVYAMLRRVERVLRAGRRGTQGMLLVVSSNAIFFSQRHRQPVMAYPCLAMELASGDADQGDLPAAARLAVPGARDSGLARLEHKLLAAATARVYLLQQRRRLAERLFGGPPRLALREGLQELLHRRSLRRPTDSSLTAAELAAAELRQRDRPWTERGLSAAQFAHSYDFVPLDSPDAVNLQWTQALARWLGGQHELAALAVLVPQNHALLGSLAAGPAYDAVGLAVATAFARAGVPFVSYDRDPALVSEHFLDLDHLTAAGNRALADRLAQALAPRLRQLAAGTR